MKNTSTYVIGQPYFQLTITNFSQPKEYPCTSEAEVMMLLDDKLNEIIAAGFHVETVVDEPELLHPYYEVWDGNELVGLVAPCCIEGN